MRDQADLDKLLESFKIIHEAYLHHREVGKDNSAEEALVEKQEQHYAEVMNKIYVSLNLLADYEKSYKIYEAAKPDPGLAKKEAEEKSSKEALAKQLKEEEALQKRETEAAGQAEEERNMKRLRAKVVVSEQVFKKSVGMYQTAKKCADDMENIQDTELLNMILNLQRKKPRINPPRNL